MSRSVWKYIYMDSTVYRYMYKRLRASPRRYCLVRTRNCVFTKSIIDRFSIFYIYTGKIYEKIKSDTRLLNSKFGEFAFSKKRTGSIHFKGRKYINKVRIRSKRKIYASKNKQTKSYMNKFRRNKHKNKKKNRKKSYKFLRYSSNQIKF